MQPTKNSRAGITIALFFIIYLLPELFHAQRAVGIFLSAKGFTQNKIAFASKKDHTYNIKLHTIFNSDYVEIKDKDSVYKISKDSVYGYKNNAGENFRFYNKKIYTIINNDKDLLLYKIISSPHTKYEQETYAYFFSHTPGEKIKELTVSNIEAAYSDNKQFIVFLELYFKNDNDLSEYDTIHKSYKLNRLLQLSKTK